MDFSALLFSFAGRLNRAPYWLAGIAVSLAVMILIWLAIGLAFVGVPLAIVFVALLVPVVVWIGFALGTKRLHDRDKSAWWLLLFYFVPAILEAIGRHTRPAGSILTLIGLGITIWALVELGFLRGTAGDNRYGPDPLQRRPAAQRSAA